MLAVFCYNIVNFMVITYHGGQYFKVSFGNVILAFNPIAKKTDWPTVKFGADMVFVSMRHPHFNGIEQVISRNRQTFVIDGAGEYEVGEVTATGYGVATNYDKKQRFNTIYKVNLEGMSMVFLGALDKVEIDDEILATIQGSDILFIPIDGGDVLSATMASKLSTKLEAKLIIPMSRSSKSIRAFLEEGSQTVKPIDKLTIKKKDVTGLEGQIAVIKP